MLNVRRSDGRVLNWILAKQGVFDDPATCTDPECAVRGTNPEVEGGIRWCDQFFEHVHLTEVP
jgi:hypothetical protein